MASETMDTLYDMSRTGKGRHLGYWVTSQVNDPSPLPWPGDFQDPTWDVGEREAVATYLDGQEDVACWRGYSFCRLGCPDPHMMGTTDKSDGVYVWPAGFSHYVREHQVRPPQEFIDHVLGRRVQAGGYRPEGVLPPMYPLPDWFQVGARVRVAHPHGPLRAGDVAEITRFDVDEVSIRAGGVLMHYARLDLPYFFEPSEG